MPATMKNWAGNVTFSAHSVRRPASVGELQDAVAGSDRARALGTGHSFNRIADTDGTLIALDALPTSIEVDSAARCVRVSGRTTFAALCPTLHRQGLALPNLGSLPHISVAGACATGTHGSGNSNVSIAAGVREVELVAVDGSLLTLDRRSPFFDGAVLSLGALGVVTNLTLDLVPEFTVEQVVWEGLPWDALLTHFDDVLGAAYSVSVFTDWGDRCQVWIKRRTDEPVPDLSSIGARAADGPRHPLAGFPPEHCTPQMGAPGPWYERLPHFRREFTPSTGDELQSEYFVDARHAVPALRAVRRLGSRIKPLLHLSELRTTAPEANWLSPSHRRACVAIHFTWKPDQPAVRQALPHVEKALAPFGARPHWGKLFMTSPSRLAASYPRWADFQALMHHFDPAGKFRNELIDQYFAADGPAAGDRSKGATVRTV